MLEDEPELKVQDESQPNGEAQHKDADEEAADEEKDIEKEESEPGSPQYDDSKRKSVPLVPEEMKVNKSSNPENTVTESNDDAPRPLSREDIRNARLAALEKRMAASKSHDNEGDEDSNVTPVVVKNFKVILSVQLHYPKNLNGTRAKNKEGP